jgi:hypothetical protein
MNQISVLRKRISLVLKAIVVISAVTGTLLSAHVGRASFMSGRRAFMYFTIQSNILIAVICAIGGIKLLKGKNAGSVWYVVKLVSTVSITLTGVVFGFLLAPLLGENAWNPQNTLTHLVVPVVAVLDYYMICITAEIKYRNVIYVIIPPILYAIYAGIAYVNGWEFATGVNYPYFFLNWGSPAGVFGFSDKLPFIGTGWWILVILVFLIIVGSVYLFTAKLIGKMITNRRPDKV